MPLWLRLGPVIWMPLWLRLGPVIWGVDPSLWMPLWLNAAAAQAASSLERALHWRGSQRLTVKAAVIRDRAT
jgi:hypothetical protein